MKMSVSENIETKKERALRILSSVYNLPTVPFIIFEVTKILEDPMASAAQLGKIIGKDQGLVTKILSVANSPLYGIPRRVSTIDFAIVILGFNHIKNIVIALSMMDTLKKFGDGQFQQKQYWMHSFITATASKRIADDLGITTSGEAFTAGLLHDLGIPIIYKYFNKEYLQISSHPARFTGLRQCNGEHYDAQRRPPVMNGALPAVSVNAEHVVLGVQKAAIKCPWTDLLVLVIPGTEGLLQLHEVMRLQAEYLCVHRYHVDYIYGFLAEIGY